MTFKQKYDAVVAKNNSLVCVGLDSDVDKIPKHLSAKGGRFQFEFNKAIIDATHDLVCAYKPNTAFYERHGVEGVQNLYDTIQYVRATYPEVLIVLDAKRADIGNTNIGYVGYAFDWLGADAITLHPYLGREALQPFLDRKDTFSFILCRTSNPGAGELQDVFVILGSEATPESDSGQARMTNSKKPLFEIVAQKVSKEWNNNQNCGLVVGATYPEELAQIRKITGDDMLFLVPGIGAQGGDVEKTVKAGLDSKKAGMIINSSRGIIFASSGLDFADRARGETTKLRDEINKYRSF